MHVIGHRIELGIEMGNLLIGQLTCRIDNCRQSAGVQVGDGIHLERSGLTYINIFFCVGCDLVGTRVNLFGNPFLLGVYRQCRYEQESQSYHYSFHTFKYFYYPNLYFRRI